MPLVYPAYAGVILKVRLVLKGRWRLSRIRGGDPRDFIRKPTKIRFIPHTWG